MKQLSSEYYATCPCGLWGVLWHCLPPGSCLNSPQGQINFSHNRRDRDDSSSCRPQTCCLLHHGNQREEKDLISLKSGWSYTSLSQMYFKFRGGGKLNCGNICSISVLFKRSAAICNWPCKWNSSLEKHQRDKNLADLKRTRHHKSPGGCLTCRQLG